MYICTKYKKQLFNLVLLASLLALNLLVVFIFQLIPKINGIALELYLVTLSISLTVIPNKIYAWILLIVFPFFKILVDPASAVNFNDLCLEYFINIYVLFPFIYFDVLINWIQQKSLQFLKQNWFIKKNNFTVWILNIILIVLFVVLVLIHAFFFVWAGYLWYTNHNWWASLIYESSGYWLTLIIDSCLYILLLPFLQQMTLIFQQKYK